MKTSDVFSTRKEMNLQRFDSRFQGVLISWRSIFAGLFLSLLVYALFISLGIGMSGTSATELMQTDIEDVEDFARGASIWVGVSVLIALMFGGYFASKLSGFLSKGIGAAHGLVVAALFFGFMLFGAGQTVGFAGKGLGALVDSVGGGASGLASSPMLQSAVENALGDVSFRSEPEVVVRGLLTRLFQGNTQSAKNFLSYQTGLTDIELDNRFARIENDFKNTLRTTVRRTASVVSAGAWSIFWILLLGSAAAAFCGAYGTKSTWRVKEGEQFQPKKKDEISRSEAV